MTATLDTTTTAAPQAATQSTRTASATDTTKPAQNPQLTQSTEVQTAQHGVEMPQAAEAAQETAHGAPAKSVRRWLAFSSVVAVTVMDLLDSTVINVAAPAIHGSLGGSLATMQWMAAGYTLALSIALLVGGRLGDMFGRKRVMMTGAAGFTLASLLASAAWSPGILLAARVLQGAFGAVMLPQTFGIIRDLFPPQEMKKAWGVFGPVMGLSAVLGPILGGLLIDADLLGTGWRMIFLINLPVGAYALTIAAKHVPVSAPADRRSRLDLTGVLLAATGTFLLLFPLVQGRDLGWPSWILIMLAASLPTFAAFGAHQVRRARAGRTSLIEPGVFRKRSFAAGVLFAIAFTAGMGGLMLTVGLFLQIGLGYTPLHASLTMAPWAMGAIVGTTISGALMTRLGRTLLHIGLAGMTIGVLGFYAMFQLAGENIGTLHFLLPNLIGGIGMGMIFTPMFDIILGEVADREVGSATGILQAVQQLGISLGVAVIGTVFFGLLGPTVLNSLHAAGIAALTTAGLLTGTFLIGFLLPKHAAVRY
ncbi:MFS transporter [Actinocrispum sp. NPDC049592]|uniref:MFS transporter n=1 Tax=Actinocrispum sp. NPDC049592 TaxID=3154835 RepID=UPI00341D45B9